MNNWTKIYADSDSFRAELVLGKLQEQGIEAVLVNKKDTAYNNFGQLEVYVPQQDIDSALTIVENATRVI